MKNILASVAVMALMAGAASAGQTVPCNPAVGNWVNASDVTCPDFGSGMQKPSPIKVAVVVVPPPPPPPPEEEPVTIY